VAIAGKKIVVVECIKTGGLMDAWEHIADKLIATKRWRIFVPETADALAAQPTPAVAPKPVPKFGEDHED
jgi:hypothetical protein